MPWCYVDDHFPDHPKIKRAGGDAGWLWLCGYAWVQRNLTGGRIPKAAVPTLSDRKTPMKLAARLVQVGLWEDDGEDYVMHDYVPYNPSAETKRQRREGTSERLSSVRRQAAMTRWHPESDASADANGDANASVLHAPDDANAPPDASGVGCKMNGFAMQTGMQTVRARGEVPYPLTQVSSSRGESQVGVHAAASEKETDQGEPQVSGAVAERWEALFPRQKTQAYAVLGHALRFVDERLVDEAIGHCVEKNSPPNSPRYLLKLCADWAQQRGANLSEETLAELLKGPT